MHQEQLEKVTYLPWDQLEQPNQQNIAQGTIDIGFSSLQWYVQFQTLTCLRQANKFYTYLFLNELLPKNAHNIVLQVENLRSNNSKEALTLLQQIIKHQQLDQLPKQIIKPIVAVLMAKSVSEKGFIKTQALKALNVLPQNWNQHALDELCSHTQSANGQISQLAIRLVAQMVQNKKDYEINGSFLKSLSLNLNGKRALVQKKAKQILIDLKNREGQQLLQLKICKSTQLLEQQTNTLRRQLKAKQVKPKNTSFKDFIKLKKQEV